MSISYARLAAGEGKG